MTILDCGHAPTPMGCASGVATDFDGDGREITMCLPCSSQRVWNTMDYRGRATLYLTLDSNRQPQEVVDWPGLLRFRVQYFKRGEHNFARTRWDVWFQDANGNRWWGVNYGDSGLVHVRRIGG